MQNSYPLLAGLLLVIACGPAAAQVTVNPKALDQLTPPGTAADQADEARRPATRPAPRPTTTRPATPAKPPAAQTQAPQPPSPPMPVVPPAPPPLPVIPPPVAVPVRPTLAPVPAAVADDAPGVASPIPDGIRVTFGTARSDLNPATVGAIRGIAHWAATNSTPPDVATFTVTSFAAGVPEDASAARRLSLARGLAVRSLLIGEGVASMRIYVKALGSGTPAVADGPPDRVDLTVDGVAAKAKATPASGSAPPPTPQARPAP
ncbi:OmpA family protein [Limobrevibacterium gyesilva]|uniref:OmpA family protein n=1 Tax=Limobrevibacterium gyesilva TaxID=2991712 RepID=A0AA41YNZ7_9PROT|nr:OmpA family protein [Limobrevibacterium gyesilva]MCW3477434.1 OmpA family protein [Limobrevibacterium gyesilva]